MSLSRFRVLIAAFLCCFSIAVSAQVSLYVDSSKTASGIGTSWPTAYKTLNEALDIANGGAAATAYNVFVATGTYYPPGTQSSTNRDSSFALLRSGIRVYGGYPAGGGARNSASNPTVLSGAIGNASDSTDNTYHVVVVAAGGTSAFSDSTILDGLQITRGAGNGPGTKNFGSTLVSRSVAGGVALATGQRILLQDCQLYNNFSSGNGGGLHMEADSVQITGGLFWGNTVLGYSAGGAICNRAKGLLRITGSIFIENRASYGGAISTNVSASRLSVDSCSFTGNVADWAGGAMLFSDSTLTADFLLNNTVFTGNKSLGGGGAGAISWRYLSAPSASAFTHRIRQCSFVGNKAIYLNGASGGALDYSQDPVLRIDTCQFFGNTAGGSGGALISFGPMVITGSTFQNDSSYNSFGGAAFFSTNGPTLSGCTFTGNYAGGRGGAIGMTNSGASLTDCVIEGNRAAQHGGGISLNGATLTRCRIRGNFAGEEGGGLYLSSSATIRNSLFSGNEAGIRGGAVSLDGWYSTAGLTNCTIAGNSAPSGVSLNNNSTCSLTVLNSILWDGTGNTINTFFTSGATLTYTTIQSGWPGVGNSTANPQFANLLPASAAPTTGGDYSLNACSPAINTGQNTGSYTGMTDLTGSPRLVADTVDRGAYEFQGVGLSPVAVGPITGRSIVCLGSTDTLFNTVPGGVWSSSNPLVASILPTGIVSGQALGQAVISYTHGTSGCAVATAVKSVSVTTANALGPITGPDSVCASATIALAAAAPGGSWVSSSNAIATVNAAGVVTGVAAGVATITYHYGPAACSSVVTKTITVGALPAIPAIGGTQILCIGVPAQFTNALAGGTWSTLSNGTTAAITASGTAAGIITGSDHIAYTVTNSFGCTQRALKLINVCTLTSTTQQIVSRDTICGGDTAALRMPTGSYWLTAFTSGNTSVATVQYTGTGTGVLTAVAPGVVTVSIAVTSNPYQSCAACSTVVTKTIVVLPPPAVATISGSASLCVGSTLQLTNATAGGVWTSTSAGSRSLVSSTGLLTAVAAGTDTVRYTVSNSVGCTAIATKIITLLAPVLAPISGADTLCTGTATSLSHATAGGTWSHFNSLPGTVSSSGIYTATAPGTDTVFYQYTSANGCGATVKKPLTLVASPAPAAITGSDSLCAGQQTLFTSAPAGGVWTTSDATVATVNSTTGVVTGLNQGLATLTYTVTNAGVCSASVSKAIFVKALPVVATISGPAVLCLNTAQQYTNVTAGGTWSSGTAGTVSAFGLYVAATAGPDTIRYAITNSFGCMVMVQLPLAVSAPQSAPVLGADSMCKGSTALFSHMVTGGTWANHNAGLGLVNAAGLYTAAMPGLDTLYYSYTSNGCVAMAKKVLRILVGDSALITGTTALCKGASQLLTPSVTGGTWISSNNTVADVTAGGQVSGISGGTAVIRYTVTGTLGCTATSAHPVTVNAPVTTTAQAGLVLTATGNQTGATYQWIDCGSNLPLAGATDPVYAAPAAGGRFAVVVSYQGCTDTSVCLTLAPAGVAEVAGRSNNVIVSYIPGSQLLINTGDRLPRACRLLDVQGKLVQEFVPKEFQTLLDVTDVAKGIYILYLKFPNEKVVRKVNIW